MPVILALLGAKCASLGTRHMWVRLRGPVVVRHDHVFTVHKDDSRALMVVLQHIVNWDPVLYLDPLQFVPIFIKVWRDAAFGPSGLHALLVPLSDLDF